MQSEIRAERRQPPLVLPVHRCASRSARTRARQLACPVTDQPRGCTSAAAGSGVRLGGDQVHHGVGAQAAGRQGTDSALAALQAPVNPPARALPARVPLTDACATPSAGAGVCEIQLSHSAQLVSCCTASLTPLLRRAGNLLRGQHHCHRHSGSQSAGADPAVRQPACSSSCLCQRMAACAGLLPLPRGAGQALLRARLRRAHPLRGQHQQRLWHPGRLPPFLTGRLQKSRMLCSVVRGQRCRAWLQRQACRVSATAASSSNQ